MQEGQVIGDMIPIRLEYRKSNDTQGGHLVVVAHVNGKEAQLIVDTGATQSALDKNRAHYFNVLPEETNVEVVGFGGATRIHLGVIKEFKIGNDIRVEEPAVILLDLYQINKAFYDRGLPMIDGIMGGDLLECMNTVIDYGSKHLLIPPTQAQSAPPISAQDIIFHETAVAMSKEIDAKMMKEGKPEPKKQKVKAAPSLTGARARRTPKKA